MIEIVISLISNIILTFIIDHKLKLEITNKSENILDYLYNIKKISDLYHIYTIKKFNGDEIDEKICYIDVSEVII